MRKIIIGCLGFIMGLSNGWAQIDDSQHRFDTLYLKDGSRLLGVTTYLRPGQKVVITDQNGQKRQIEETDIDRIVLQIGTGDFFNRDFRQLGNRSDVEEVREEYSFEERGFYTLIYASAAAGRYLGERKIGPGLHAIVGYQFNRWIGAGIGIGLDSYSEDVLDLIFPVYAEARGYLLRKANTPYFSVNAGYGFPVNETDEPSVSMRGGFVFHPAVGLRLGAGEGANFLFDVGYKTQKAVVSQNFPWGEDWETEKVFRRFVVRAGVIF